VKKCNKRGKETPSFMDKGAGTRRVVSPSSLEVSRWRRDNNFYQDQYCGAFWLPGEKKKRLMEGGEG